MVQKTLSNQTDIKANMSCIIVIPVYKPTLSDDERLSLLQCFTVLEKYDIALCCPQSLDTKAYDVIVGREIKTERFHDYFFKSIDSYNDLMTEADFYSRFQSYDYMLIYQLDAFVFSDQLQKWCEKGYDYIGSPWFKHQRTYEEGYPLWCSGNGGFSLRRISKFLDVTSSEKIKEYKCDENALWEDTFFADALNGTPYEMKKPTAEEAALFGFECSPSYLFQLTNGTLPFGCHAWRKYEFDTFWHTHIPAKPTLSVSIVTIAYNDIDNLKKTRESIISQTFHHYEWIVIDGGSTDGTKEYLEQHASEMAYWCSEKDNGVYDAQNKGTQKAAGDYVIYMNAGDTFFDAHVLENVFSKPHSGDVLYGNWTTERESGKRQDHTPPAELTFSWFYCKNICHQAMFIKTSLLKKSPYRLDCRLYGDWAKWMELSYQGKVFEYVPYTICVFMLGGMSGLSEESKMQEMKRIRHEYYPGSLKTMALRFHNANGVNPDYIACKGMMKNKRISQAKAKKEAIRFITSKGYTIGDKIQIMIKYLWYRILSTKSQK